MTKALTVAALLLFSVSCNNSKTEAAAEPAADTTAAAAAPAPPHQYAVKATYSSSFEIGDPSLADKVVELWKQYDDNTLDKGLELFADTVTVWDANGWRYHGTKDSLLTMVKKMRNAMSSSKSELVAVVPLKSTDKDENWVVMYGTEYTTTKNKKDSADIQENWRFNKDGNVDMLHSYRRKK